MAACSTSGVIVTCAGAANPLAPSYSNGANNLTVNVIGAGSLGVLLGIGGDALKLSGNNVTLNNNGTIDPALLGHLSLLSSGAVIGNSNASIVTINNSGLLKGTTGLLGAELTDFTGMALAVSNAGGGISKLSNSGAIESSALLGTSLDSADAPVIASYGGAVTNFTNWENGRIRGRMAFESPADGGNQFLNAGTIEGSVSLGSKGGNTFIAVTGSSLIKGLGVKVEPMPVIGHSISFAGTGTVDGGAGGGNNLVLQNSSTGPGLGGHGSGTVSADTFKKFSHLVVNSGTWTVQGAIVSSDATLNDGVVFINDAGVFGTGSVTANGGGLAVSGAPVSLPNPISMGRGGLNVFGNNGLTLAGVLSGVGGLTKQGTGRLTLTAPNSYSGVTTVSGGVLQLAGNGSFGAAGQVALTAGGSVLDVSALSFASTIGMLSGVVGAEVNLGSTVLNVGDARSSTFSGSFRGAGSLVKQGSGTLSLDGSSQFTGGTIIVGGTLVATGPQALGAGEVIVNGGTLAGAAQITGAVTLNGAGSIVPGPPGATSGTLYAGSFTQTGGTLRIKADTAGNISALAVQGNASLGGTLVIDLPVPMAVGRSFTVLNSIGGQVSGTFADVLASNLPGDMELKLEYRPTSVVVHVFHPAVRLGLQGPSATAVGTAQDYTVSALDALGNATAGYTGTVRITSSDPLAVLPGNVPLVNGTATFGVTLKSAGTQTLTVTDTVTNSIMGSISVAVTKAATTTTLSASPASTDYGQLVTLTAHVALPAGVASDLTGTVRFSDDTAPVAGCAAMPLSPTGDATCTTDALVAGRHNLGATYAGDANTATSSAQVQHEVEKAGTTMTLSASPLTVAEGQSVTMKAVVTSGAASARSTLTKAAKAAPASGPAGGVTFFDGTTRLGNATLDANGVATFTVSSLDEGVHDLRADYAGTADFASAQAQFKLTVTAAQAVAVRPVPMLSEMALVLLSLVASVIGVWRLRRS